MDKPIILHGGCCCGAVHYQITVKPSFSFHCYCRQCQRITGAGHASQFMVDKSHTSINGDLNYFKLDTEGGNTKNIGFCAVCGNPILTSIQENPANIFFHASSLDDPSLFKPEKLIYTDNCQTWDYINPQLDT